MNEPIKIGLERYGLEDHALIITGVAEDRAGLVYTAAQRALEQLSSSLERNLRSSSEGRRLIVQECEKRLQIFDPLARVEVQRVRLSDEEEESAAYFSSAVELSQRAREIERELREALPPSASSDPAQQQRDWMAAAHRVLAQRYLLPSPQREQECSLLIDVFRQSAPVALPSSSPLWEMPSLLPAPFSRRVRPLKLATASDEQLRNAILAPSVVWAARQVAAGSDPSQQDLQRIQTALLCSRKEALKLIALVLHTHEQEMSESVGRRPGSGEKIRLYVEDLKRPERVDAEMNRLGAFLDADRDKVKAALEAIERSFGEMTAGSNFLTLRLRVLERHVQNLVGDWLSLPKELLRLPPAMEAVHLVHELADRMAVSEDDLRQLNEVTEKLQKLEQSLASSPESASLDEVHNAIKAAKALPGGPGLQRALARMHKHLETSQASMQALVPEQDERALWLKIALAVFSLGLASLISWAIRYVPYQREKARLEALVRSDLAQMQRLTARLRSATRDWAAASSGHNRKTIEQAARTLAEIFEEIRPLTLEVAGDQNAFSPSRLKAVLQATAIATGVDASPNLEGAAALVEHCLQTRNPTDLDAACHLAGRATTTLVREGVAAARRDLEDFFECTRNIVPSLGVNDNFSRNAVDQAEQAVLRAIADEGWETQWELIDAKPTSAWVSQLPLARALQAVGPEGRDALFSLLRGQHPDWNQIPAGACPGLLRVGLGEVAPSLLNWDQRQSLFQSIRSHLNGLDPLQEGFKWTNRLHEDLWNALQVFDRSKIAQFVEDYKGASRRAHEQARRQEAVCNVGESLQFELAMQFTPVKTSLATFFQSLEENGNTVSVPGLYGAVSSAESEQMLVDWSRNGYLRLPNQPLHRGLLIAPESSNADRVVEIEDRPGVTLPSNTQAAVSMDGQPRPLYEILQQSLRPAGAIDEASNETLRNRFTQVQKILHQGSVNNWARVFQFVLPRTEGWTDFYVNPDGFSLAEIVEPRGPSQGVILEFRLAFICVDENAEFPRQLACTARLELNPEDLDSEAVVDHPFELRVSLEDLPPPSQRPIAAHLREKKKSTVEEMIDKHPTHWDGTLEGLKRAVEHRFEDPMCSTDALDSLANASDISSTQLLQEIEGVLMGASADNLLDFFSGSGIALLKPIDHLRGYTLPETTPDSIRLARMQWQREIVPRLLHKLVQQSLPSTTPLAELFPPNLHPIRAEAVRKWLVSLHTLESLLEAAQNLDPPSQWVQPLEGLILEFRTNALNLSGTELFSFLEHLGQEFLAQWIPLPQYVLESPFYGASQAYQLQIDHSQIKALMESLPYPTPEGQRQLEELDGPHPRRAAAFARLMEFAPLRFNRDADQDLLHVDNDVSEAHQLSDDELH